MEQATILPDVEQEYERYISQVDRKDMDASDFGDPQKRAFPVLNQHDLDNAARLIGHADNPDAVKKRLIAIAKRKGLSLPDAWKDAKESVTPTLATPTTENVPFAPKPRIATMTLCFLEYDAISLNGRQYPQAVCETIIQSAQKQLSTPDAPPIPCYTSHAMAEMDNTLKLIGKATDIFMQGAKAYAKVDIPDTTAGRDIASLVANKYIATCSLRVSGVATKVVRGKSIPQVVQAQNEQVRLLGIDLTMTPGLAGVASIGDVAFESAYPDDLIETFPFSGDSFIVESIQEDTMADEAKETQETGKETQESSAIPSMASGNTVGVSDGPTQSDYAKRQLTLPPSEDPTKSTTALTTSSALNTLSGDMKESMQRVHDNAAAQLGMACAPSSQESGAKLSKVNALRAASMHDEAAHALKMQCEGAYKPAMAQNAPSNDTEDDGMESVKKPTTTVKESTKVMTPEEMKAALEAMGHTIVAPKTKEELLKEEFEARLADERKAFQEQLEANQKVVLESIAKLTPVHAAPQRKSQVLVENATSKSQYALLAKRNGRFLESLTPEQCDGLAHRYEELPEGMQSEQGLDQALKEFSQVLAYQIDQKWNLQEQPQ